MNSLGNSLDTVHIKDLRPGLKNFSITFIVLDVGLPVPLKENREVRTLKVSDSTACINLSLWDEPGAAISSGDIIRLTKAYAGVWRNALTLYSGKNGDIQKIGEFCMVFNEQINMSEPNMNLVNAIGNQPGSGSMNNTLNNGTANNIGLLQNRPGPLSSSQSAPDRKNSARYSNERDHELPSSAKHQSKTNPRAGGRGGGQRNVVRSDKR